MAWARPTLSELIDRATRDIGSRLTSVVATLRRSLVNGLARMHAGAVHGLYGYLSYIADQILPDTMDEAHFERYATRRGVPRIAATAATGGATVPGTDGKTVPATTVLQRGDGVQYTVDADATVVGGSATLALTAVAVGLAGNSAANDQLTFVVPVDGVQSTATVDANGLTGGADIETLDSWKAREKAIEQAPPQGGNGSDYDDWARQVAGVTRVWTFNNWVGPGSVGVYFMRDGDADPIPNAAEVAAVQAAIDAERPLGMGRGATVYAPTAHVVDMTIQLAPNDVATQTAVRKELADLFLSEAQVEDGNGLGILLLSHLDDAISRADGETDHVLVSPAANVAPAPGEIAKLGTITWQAIP